jgi:hypothetical protein
MQVVDSTEQSVKGTKKRRLKRVKRNQPNKVFTQHGNETQFPMPPTKTIHADSEATWEKGTKFIEYWLSLPEPMVELADVRTYREWPIIDRKLSNAENNQSISRIQGKCPFTVENWREELLHRFGTGTYKFMMNEAGTPGWVCQAYVKTREDMESHPPRIDLRELNRGHPDNQSYIDGLRARGTKFPGDPDYVAPKDEERKDDMEGSAVQELVSTVRELATERNQPTPIPLTEQAVVKAMEMTNKAANTSIEMVRDTNTKLSTANAAGQDPAKMLGSLVDVVQKIVPKPDDTVLKQVLADNAALRKDITDMQTARMKSLEDEIKASRAIVTAPPSKEKTLLEQLDERIAIDERLDKLTGRNKRRKHNDDDDDDEDQEEKPRKMGMLEKIVNVIPVISTTVLSLGQIGASMMHNYAVAQSAAAAVRNPAQPPQPGPQPEKPPELPAGALPAGQTDEAGQIRIALEWLTSVQPVFFSHFFGEKSGGDTFAHWVVTSGMGADQTLEGRQTYESVKAAGKANILSLLQMHALWGQIGSNQGKVEQFVENFIDYDRLREEAEGELDDEPEERAADATANAGGGKTPSGLREL